MRFPDKYFRQVKGEIIYLPAEEIFPNPVQPRRGFDQDGLLELACSIREYGVLNPLTVRLRRGRYELIAGERRLRAAKLAGLSEVPCILLDVNMAESGLIALVENLQRRDLNFVEEAEGISRLVRVFGMSQEEVARRLGKSQPAVANKLRLLRLPEDVLAALLENGLSERHGRALLRLDSPDKQRAALELIISGRMTVAQSDAYIDSLLEPCAGAAIAGGGLSEKGAQDGAGADKKGGEASRRGGKTRYLLKDVRLFLNTLSRGVDMMRQSGVPAAMERRETDGALIITISIPKPPEG